MNDVQPVSVSRRVAATPPAIFSILTDPGRHLEIDGSGMLRGAVDAERVAGVGDVFVMRMHHEDFGDYEMTNTVVEYEPDRLIAWEPARLDMDPWHYRWRYELVADEGDGDVTVVTESFDLSRSPDEARRATRDGAVWTEAITASLERLEQLCSLADAPADH